MFNIEEYTILPSLGEMIFKGVQDRQVSVVIFFHIYIFFFALLLVWVTLSVVIKIIIIINK